MKPLFFITIVFCSLILSCKKNHEVQPAEPVSIQFNPDGLAYVQVPVNNYYIFKDSANGMLDSVVVTQSTLDNTFSPERVVSLPYTEVKVPAYYYQDFKLQLSSITGSTQKVWFYATATNQPFFTASGLQNSDTAYLSLSESDVNFPGEVFTYPVSYYFSGQSKSIIIPAMTVEGTSYSNVINFISSNNADPTDKNFVRATYFWAKNVGIIKREIKTPKTVKTESLLRHS